MFPRRAAEMVPCSSDTTRQSASVCSDKPRAAAWRVPLRGSLSRLLESGRWQPSLTMRSSSIVTAPSCPSECGSKMLFNKGSLSRPSTGSPPSRWRLIASAPRKTTSAPIFSRARSPSVRLRISTSRRGRRPARRL